MCGIAGLLAVDDGARGHDLRALAARMAGALSHRGPDGSGAWAEGAAALGHARLAVIDLSETGRQPMLSPGGRWAITFNGEVYNHRALRRDLEAEGALRRAEGGGAPGGVALRGTSDTEVLLAAIEAWGMREALARANGMFAFAAWDRAERTLHLARDRMGEKPLYVGRVGPVVAFASELRALRRLPWFRHEVDRDALTSYLRLGYVPAPRTIQRGVSKLPPASTLAIGPSGAIGPPERYWRVEEVAAAGARDPFRGTLSEATEAVGALLDDAVRMRMEADVPLGAFLSGGIDSSAVVAAMVRASARPVRTYTIGVDDPAFDEAPFAAEAARRLGTEHTTLRVTAREAMSVVPRLGALYDEPFADASQVPTRLVCEAARRHVTVALTGDGGDEVFGGYNRYVWTARIRRVAAILPASLRAAFAGLVGAVSTGAWEGLFARLRPLLPAALRVRSPADKLKKLADMLAAPGDAEAYLRLVSGWRDPGEVVIGAQEGPGEAQERADGFDAAWEAWGAAGAGMGLLSRLQLTDQLTYLPDDILVKLDRASMSVGLEARAPFLDHRLVELAWRLPAHMRVRGGRGKILLRRLLRRELPAALVERPKAGFAIPLGGWLRGPLRDWAAALLDPARLAREGYLDPRPIAEAWRAHTDGRVDRHVELWSVLMFQAWRESLS